MKKISLFFFLSGMIFICVTNSVFCEENTKEQITIDDLKIVYKMPSKWFLADHQNDVSKNTQMYLYKRESIINNGIEVIPAIGFVFEEVPSDVDVVTYSIQVRRRLFPVDIKSVFLQQTGEIQLTNAIGYNTEYTDNRGLKHVFVFVHAVYKGKGIQIIIDTISDIYPQIKTELDEFLKSIEVVE